MRRMPLRLLRKISLLNTRFFLFLDIYKQEGRVLRIMRSRINVLAVKKARCAICHLFPPSGLLTSESKRAQEVRNEILIFVTWTWRARSTPPLDAPGTLSYGRNNAPDTRPARSGTYNKYFLNSFLLGTSFVPTTGIGLHSQGSSWSPGHIFLL